MHDLFDFSREILRDLEIRAVHAQHELCAGGHCGSNFSGVERVDAHAHPRGDELAHDVAQFAAARTASGAMRGTLLISATISMSQAP